MIFPMLPHDFHDKMRLGQPFSTELFLFRLEQRVATALNLQRTAQARWAKVGSVAIFVAE